MITKRGIEANSDKCHAVIFMRNPVDVKEGKKLIGHLVALSRLLSCVGDKAFILFSTMKKKVRFNRIA